MIPLTQSSSSRTTRVLSRSTSPKSSSGEGTAGPATDWIRCSSGVGVRFAPSRPYVPPVWRSNPTLRRAIYLITYRSGVVAYGLRYPSALNSPALWLVSHMLSSICTVPKYIARKCRYPVLLLTVRACCARFNLLVTASGSLCAGHGPQVRVLHRNRKMSGSHRSGLQGRSSTPA